jgi:hypothetical protein
MKTVERKRRMAGGMKHIIGGYKYGIWDDTPYSLLDM